MDIDYSQGRYNVFNANGVQIGRIDEDEFVRQGNKLLYRIDGAEVYTINGELLAFIESGAAITPNGERLFTISGE